MSDDLRAQADARLNEALEVSGARDPREWYRRRLLALREADPSAYERAVEYYKTVLVPEIANGAEPLAAWTDYGCTLEELHGPGRPVSIDPSGRSGPYTSPAPRDHLVLHLPTATREAARLIGLPAELSSAQRATYAWLVDGATTLPAPAGAST